MSRHGFVTGMRMIARESARLQRQKEAAQRRQLGEQTRHLRESARLANQLVKAQRQQYLSDRQSEADDATAALNDKMEELCSILETRLNGALRVSFASLREAESLPPFLPPSELASPRVAPRLEDFRARVRCQNFPRKGPVHGGAVPA